MYIHIRIVYIDHTQSSTRFHVDRNHRSGNLFHLYFLITTKFLFSISEFHYLSHSFTLLSFCIYSFNGSYNLTYINLKSRDKLFILKSFRELQINNFSQFLTWKKIFLIELKKFLWFKNVKFSKTNRKFLHFFSFFRENEVKNFPI